MLVIAPSIILTNPGSRHRVKCQTLSRERRGAAKNGRIKTPGIEIEK